MPQPVFISYARDASREHAQALHDALGGRTAFLDTVDIEPGDRFPEALVDALFGARVVVIFAEPRYFTRWYCLLEFRMARTPFLRAAERPGATAAEKEEALRGLVVAMPPRGVDPMMDRFPPLVQARNWPDVTDIDRIAEMVLAELAANPPTLRERYAAVADADEARRYLLEATRLPQPLRIGNVPFVPQVGLPNSIGNAFVGRSDDLWRIHDLLWTERGDPATAAGLTGSIEAIGGFGKTRLALEYLYRFGPRHFRGGLFWINAESDSELQLYDVLQSLNPQAPAIEHVRQTPGGVPAVLARAIRGRADDAPAPLFIIDNVPEPEQGHPPRPLETWCPVLGEVPVLTTSRTRVSLGAGGTVLALPIETLHPDAAVALLATELQRNALADEEWKAIAEWVGHLPLALEVLNRLLRSGEMTPRALLELSREERPSAAVDAAMESIRGVVPAGALRGITEAFSASYERLTLEEQYAARLIAWMAPAPIPTFVIEAVGLDVFSEGVRAKLRHRSFVMEEAASGSELVYGAMHRVLADFLYARSEDIEGDAIIVVKRLTKAILNVHVTSYDAAGAFRGCVLLISAVLGNYINRAVTGESFQSLTDLANLAGVQSIERGFPALADGIFGMLAVLSERYLGAEDPDTLSLLSNWAVALGERGDYDAALHLDERIMEIRVRSLGETHPDTIASMNNLVASRGRRGDYAGSLEIADRVLALRVQTGAPSEVILRAMNNLAGARYYVNDLAGAQELQEQVVDIREKALGFRHPDTLSAVANLAETLNVRGEYQRAQELGECALKAAQDQVGTTHPLTTDIAWVLLSTYGLTGQAEALDQVVRESLIWLLNRAPDELTGRQLELRDRLLSFLSPA